MAKKRSLQTAGEKTCIKSTGFIGFGESSSLAAVDVKDGKILRIRPFAYDSKYTPEEFRPWKLEARGQIFKPPIKSMPVPLGTAYKKRVYSPNRILYPLKRVDWEPNGERNPQNRGVSKFERISWDQATDIIAGEIRRIIDQYGPEAILAQGLGHGEEKVVHGPHGCFVRLLDLLGGYTLEVRNPDSWEGWYWGAKHAWGCEPCGMPWGHQGNLYYDIANHSDMVLFWGCDPETTPWGWGGHMVGRFCYWFTDLGIKQVYICPDVNYGNAAHADKWIPVKPNTDAALQLAIAYTWFAQGTYDKAYLNTHAVGVDKFEAYVMGEEDGVAKTPKWAEPITGVPARIIKALARYWASHTVSIAHGLGGPFIRGPFSHEPARLEVLLLAMQGLGKPGANQLNACDMSFIAEAAKILGPDRHTPPPTPGGVVRPAVKEAYRGHHPPLPMPKQIIPKTLLHDAILKGSFSIMGSANQQWPVEDQFVRYYYPVEGCSEIHMMWSDSGCYTTCWNDSNSMIKAWRSPKIEFIISEHPWLEGDSTFADLILPVSTKYEQDDIGDDSLSAHFDTIFMSNKCIEPVGESKSDYEIACMVADKLGLLEEYTMGKSVEQWKQHGWKTSGVKEMITWKELKEKGYYVVPTNPDWKELPTGMIEFYNDPEKYPLQTPTGKIEFYSQRLAEHFPDDLERPPIPKYIPHGESHQECLELPRAKDYPLLCMSNHPRWRVHAQCDDINWLHEIVTCKIKGPDGYLYEPAWIHPTTAAERGIDDGQVVEVFNERGRVLCGARVWERVMPGVVYVDHGARYDPIIPGELDRGGAINTITPHNCTSKNCKGMATSGFLVEAKPADLDQLQRRYPEAFSRPYDRASGLRFERILA